MQYIDPEGNYPRYYGDIMNAHSKWKKGDPLPNGWVLVQDGEVPEVGVDEVIIEAEPIQKNGEYFQNFQVRAMTPAEIERRDAPVTARQKLLDLGLTEVEIQALGRGL